MAQPRLSRAMTETNKRSPTERSPVGYDPIMICNVAAVCSGPLVLKALLSELFRRLVDGDGGSVSGLIPCSMSATRF